MRRILLSSALLATATTACAGDLVFDDCLRGLRA